MVIVAGDEIAEPDVADDHAIETEGDYVSKAKTRHVNSGMKRASASVVARAGQSWRCPEKLLCSTAVIDTQFRVRKATSSSARMASRPGLRGKAWLIGSVRIANFGKWAH